MTKQDILDYLKIKAIDRNCSIALHTTSEKKAAEAICKNGLYETSERALEGTLKFFGRMSQLSASDFDYFFPYTNYTVVVAIPSQIEANRIKDNLGGNKPICEFSRLFSFSKIAKNQFPEFFYGTKIRVPPNLIIGFYDKDFHFYDNPLSQFSSEDFVRYGQSLRERFDENKDIIELFEKLNQRG